MDTSRHAELQEEATRYRALAATARTIATRFATAEVRGPLEEIYHKYERFAREAEEATRS